MEVLLWLTQQDHVHTCIPRERHENLHNLARDMMMVLTPEKDVAVGYGYIKRKKKHQVF